MTDALLNKLVQGCSTITKPAGFIPSYGTAGFRADADLLHSTTYRCGVLTALRALHKGASCGIMITASHNVHTDNGVKLVDPNGDMLSQDWEPLANKFAQASTPEELSSALQPLLPTSPLSPTGLSIVLGHDTRPSSAPLAALAEEGITLLGLPVINLGCVTTPQLHYAVVDYNTTGAKSLDSYFTTLVTGFNALQAAGDSQKTGITGQCHSGSTTEGEEVAAFTLYVDCANGVGAKQLQKLLGSLEPGVLRVELRNTGEGLLNDGVGADFVQKQKRVPAGFEGVAHGSRCCSMDGDADRLVYFTTATDGSFQLLDGDRIAVLTAAVVQRLLSQLPSELGQTVKVGVVQTAYANGASTRYIKEVLQLPVVMTKTGVKHLHAAAHKFDVGIYFEANGHGTVLIFSSLAHKLQQVAGSCTAASLLLALRQVVNQYVGDALSLILTVEACLRFLGWDLTAWLSVYSDLPSCMTKLQVADRSVFATSDDDTICLSPGGIQEGINKACANYPQSRAFVRPSGTEDIVRVYAEAHTQEAAQKLAVEVMQLVYDLAGGRGPRPQ